MGVNDSVDMDEITVTEIKYKDHPETTRDIVIEFPEYMRLKKISFLEHGLINALPGVTEATDSTDVIPKVAIKFFGRLKTIYK